MPDTSSAGSDGTHCRTGPCGMTWSLKRAAVCGMPCAPHDVQNPRRLQQKANRAEQALPALKRHWLSYTHRHADPGPE